MTMWIMPLRVAPVVSYEMLRKGSVKRPLNGLDRLNLTDVGEALIFPHLNDGGDIELRDVRLPYPWNARLKGEAELNVEAVWAGGSTFRSIFRLRFGEGGAQKVKDMLDALDRDPLDSPYWDTPTWERFFKGTGSTKNDVSKSVNRTMKKLGRE